MKVFEAAQKYQMSISLVIGLLQSNNVDVKDQQAEINSAWIPYIAQFSIPMNRKKKCPFSHLEELLLDSEGVKEYFLQKMGKSALYDLGKEFYAKWQDIREGRYQADGSDEVSIQIFQFYATFETFLYDFFRCYEQISPLWSMAIINDTGFIYPKEHKLYVCDSLPEYIKQIFAFKENYFQDQLPSNYKKQKFLYRGHAELGYQMLPSICRLQFSQLLLIP